MNELPIDIEFINFIDLKDKEKQQILAWRNDPKIKKWMYQQEEIQLIDHLNFINSLKENRKKEYFLIKKKEIPIGVINFNYKSKFPDFGLYKNLELKEKGLGFILVQCIINHAFNKNSLSKLHLEVFESNQRAIQLYKKFNFKEIQQAEKYNQKIIIMELANEN